MKEIKPNNEGAVVIVSYYFYLCKIYSDVDLLLIECKSSGYSQSLLRYAMVPNGWIDVLKPYNSKAF